MELPSIQAKTITLTNGRKMPVFGLGTYLTQNQSEMTNLLRAALDAGYRHIDTAKYYANEKFIGDSLQVIFSEGKYKREDLFIATKILGAKGTSVEEIVNGQLKDLQLDYVDILYLHFPIVPPGDGLKTWNHKPVHQVWAELEAVYNKKQTRALGISNFNAMAIVDLLAYCKVKPVVNQIELHVFLQQTRLVEFLIAIKIYPVAQSPLAQFTSVIDNQELKAIAKSNHSTVPQVLLAFLLSQGITVIPKTEKISRLRENLESVNIKLSEEDIQKLKNLNSNSRVVDAGEAYNGFFKGVPLYD